MCVEQSEEGRGGQWLQEGGEGKVQAAAAALPGREEEDRDDRGQLPEEQPGQRRRLHPGPGRRDPPVEREEGQQEREVRGRPVRARTQGPAGGQTQDRDPRRDRHAPRRRVLRPLLPHDRPQRHPRGRQIRHRQKIVQVPLRFHSLTDSFIHLEFI